jgi:hypothetical protein
VAEGVVLVGRPRRAGAAEEQEAVSATEWIDSASIDEAPVTRNPTNFAIAIPRLARNAAAIAFLLPSCIRRPPRR